MKVLYTHHARQRMIQRKIDEKQVDETLEGPDEILPGDNGGDIAIRKYGNREIRVVFREVEPDIFLVFTVIKPRV